MASTSVPRRDFLKLSAALGATAGLGVTGLQWLGGSEAAAQALGDTWIPPCCNMCGGTTGIAARVYNGRVIKIEPNSFNPVGVCNISTDYATLKGSGARKCPKGNAGIMTLYDPDRVKRPLKRIGARGAGHWEEISYEQAVREIAFKLTQIYNFAGTSLDTSKWNASGATQINGITMVGSGSWGNRYLFSSRDYDRANGVTFQARVVPENASGNQSGMFGFRKVSSGYSYTRMPHAINFSNGTFYIYEDGNSRGTFGSYTRNVAYDVRIVLKSAGAKYYYKLVASDTWTLSYDSNYSSEALLNVGMTVNSGTFKLNELRVTQGAKVVSPVFEMSEPGTYDVTLTVTDNALQSGTDTTTLTISDGEPPVAHAGGPYTAEVGSQVLFNGTGSTDDYAIESYEWTFGDTSGAPLNLPFTGKGATPSHAYRVAGTYNVTLKVTDATLKTSTDTTTVNIVTGNPPVANAGGPYTGGAGGPVYFDGSGSSDDYGIVEYRWDVDATADSDGDGNSTNDINVTGRNPFYIFGAVTGPYFTEDFTGTTIDGSKWLASGATQNDRITIAGNGSWGGRYIFSQANYVRGNAVVFQGQVLPVNTTGNQYGMWGVKDTGTNYSYSQMPHAIYFNNGAVQIYEKNSYKGQLGSYTRGVLYDVKIELKSSGAAYYIKQASQGSWTKLYESTVSITDSPMKVGATVSPLPR